MKWILLMLFGSLGLSALITGAVWGFKRLPLFQTGYRTEGTVVAQEESVSTETVGRDVRTSREVTTYTPVVEFHTETGTAVRFTASTGGKHKPIIETGATVEVIYNPDDPANAQLTAFSQFWLGPVVLVGAGLLFLVMGVGGFFLIGGHDRAMDTRFDSMMRERLVFTAETPPVKAIIVRTEKQEGQKERYVFVCKGKRPGSPVEEEFLSSHFTFDPGRSFKGVTVDVYLDPARPTGYYVNIDPLLPEIVHQQRNR
ncbi:MAG: DUF3592 domain-containing protein [Proteobacteria bacterium]|nr:DUF3592 domain-containing protein [Pseudomonadota bacterium]MBU1738647.1 DUF3592 domain-containing protein [Pseudomonadota bacterium]